MKVSALLASLAITINSAAAVTVYTGEQFNYDTNYAVAWDISTNVCKGSWLIAPTSESPCDHGFYKAGAYYHLENCGTDDFGLYDADHQRIGPCTRLEDKKYTCPIGYHDVIRHWSCGDGRE
ncbi:hypothetical protein BJY00DRAFT_318519 [Aspergillus carlsbadensis]|nr:hypothetical protein BJY00DRAFT_318519 [Aspergillus carlsbadensis]